MRLAKAVEKASRWHQIMPLILKMQPSTMKASAFSGAAGSMNWGTKARKKSATLGLSTLVSRPCR
ncbi:hypothetical protein D3C84_1307150 [compost metagenome]